MINRARRFLIAAFAVCAAVLLFHERIADTLVTRGDGALAAGQVNTARALYARALLFRPHATTASERLIFSDLEVATVKSLREAMALSEEALRQDPNNIAILTDRALCALRLGDDRAAEAAFYRAGTLTHDGKLLYLSALAAKRLGENVDIRMFESHHAGAGKRA